MYNYKWAAYEIRDLNELCKMINFFVNPIQDGRHSNLTLPNIKTALVSFTDIYLKASPISTLSFNGSCEISQNVCKVINKD